MVKSLYSGVSGLKTHQQRMDVIGNNIANVNTIGNKADVVTFKDVYYQTKRSPSGATSTLGGVNPRQVGYGVQMNTTSANMTQSGYTQSDNIYDMAINGNGFFQVMDGAGNIFYTRAGAFTLDDQGYLVNADGYHVLGVTGDSTNQQAGSEIIRCVIPNTDSHASSATKMINGTNVTLSVTAPSEYTNISVGFVDSEYPFASFSNNILSIYFNRDKQYESEEDFERAISQAIQAGGVKLPDGVELQFDFETIPDDPNSKAAKNSIDGLEFTTPNSTCEFEASFTKTGATAKSHAYMSFAVDDVPSTDQIIINHNANKDAVVVSYAAGVWNISINESNTFADISDALSKYIKENPAASNLSITGFLFPNGANKEEIIEQWAKNTGGKDQGLTGVTAPATPAPMSLKGVAKGDTTGSFDLAVQEKGAFANNYEVTFAYVSGYDKTKAVWDGNTLTVTVCANTKISDINEAIKTASNGDSKKILRFNDISGLDYGVVEESYTDNSVTPAVTVNIATFVNGYTRTDRGGTVEWKDENGAVLDATGFTTPYSYVREDGSTFTFNGPADLPVTKTNADDIWNPGMRDAFFTGHPSVRPTDGADSFFTGVAKSLSTFSLTDGRIGAAQTKMNFTDVTVQQDGRIIGTHPVHGHIEIGRIDLANFDNPNGLAKVGGTCFQATVASGEPKLAIPGEDGAGVVLSGALEMSNVDLADEFTNMITTQRGYQANSRVITVSDTMLEELLSLKR